VRSRLTRCHAMIFRRWAAPSVKNTSERVTSREGINAVQTFFKRSWCVLQEVAQQDDFGKDGYVDLGNDDGVITCLCSALQVKSGVSYKLARGGYFIPLDDHAETWRFSTVPVFGIVSDPYVDALRCPRVRIHHHLLTESLHLAMNDIRCHEAALLNLTRCSFGSKRRLQGLTGRVTH